MRRKMETLEDENRELKDYLDGLTKDEGVDKVSSVISENAALRKQLQELQQKLGQSDSLSHGSGKENRGMKSEGNIWQLMMRGRR